MSNFEFRGRRVTDPKPAVHTPGLNADRYLGTDLQSAWDVASSAKSAMRQAEHHLHEADHPRIHVYPGSTGLGRDAASSVTVDRIPKYTLDSSDLNSMDTVDDMGRSSYMKSKMGLGSRKVSRMDSKYHEKERAAAVSSLVSQDKRDDSHALPRYVSRQYYGSSSSDANGSSLQSKTVPYKYPASSNFGSSKDSSLNLTDSQVIRETSVRFLNDNAGVDTRKRGYDSSHQTKMTRVDVQVPSSRHESKVARNKLAQPSSRGQSEPVVPERITPPISTDTTYTLPEPKRSNRLHQSLKNVDHDTADGLVKLRELIRQQRSSWSSKEENSETGSTHGQVPDLEKRPHRDNEPIVPRQYSLYQENTAVCTAPRKVASGPPPPTYKGFSESETRYKTPDGKVFKSHEIEKCDIKPESDLQTREKRVKSASHGTTQQQTKPSKQARVIAPQKPTKHDKKDIITTRSWRDGQKAVLKELGQNKINKPLHSPPTLGKPSESTSGNKRKNEDAIRIKQENGINIDEKEEMTAKLPASAKSILADLDSDKSDSDCEQHKSDKDDCSKQIRKSPSRKKHRISEEEKKPQKIRHYDSDSVRKFMAKQKADRKKREQDERDAARKAQESKHRHLEQLYNAQRSKGKHPTKSQGSDKDILKKDDKFSQEADVAQKLSRQEQKNESDKENHGLHPWSDVSSSDSATLTEDSMAEPTKIGKAAGDDKVPDHGWYKKALPEKDNNLGSTPNNFVSTYLQDAGITAEDIIKKFSKEPGKSEYIPPNSSLPARDIKTGPSIHNMLSNSGFSYRNRTERIQNIHQMSITLQSRIQEEAKTIQGDKWAQPREDNYTSRYDRMTKKNEPYSVFDKNLPGVGSMRKTAHRIEEDSKRDNAAVRIQAAYRGHTVRQTLNWQSPSKHISPARNYLHKSTHLTDDSLMSDSTITDDERSLPEHKIGAALHFGSYHHAFPDDASEPEFAELPRPSRTLPAKTWDKPHSDPYSVFNIYSRRNRTTVNQDTGISNVSAKRTLSPASCDDTASLSGISPTHSLTYGDEFSKHSALPTSQRVSYKDDFTSVASSVTSHGSHGKSSTRAAPINSGHSYKAFKKFASKKSDHDQSDDTLDGTLTPPPEWKFERTDVRTDARPPLLEGQEAPVRSVILSSKSHTLHEESDLSELSSLGEDPLRDYYKTSAAPGGYSTSALSPGALGGRMAAELHLLDGVEESLRQITDVERVRGVTMAQQESVALAQILKAQNTEHMHDMAQLQLKAQQESVAASRQLEDARKRAADATQNAALAIADIRSETSVSAQTTAAHFIETQAEAARATADATRKLAQAQLALTAGQGDLNPRETGRVAGEAAAAAASAAVTAAMKKYQIQHLNIEDRGTQYSKREEASLYTSESLASDTGSPSYSSKGPSRPSSRTTNYSSRTAADSSQTQLRTESAKSSVVVTAEDSTVISAATRSSVPTESGASAAYSTHTDRITEDIHSDKEDYTADFDTSGVDDFNTTLQEMLPSVSHQKNLKSQTSQSDVASFSSDDNQSSSILSPGPVNAVEIPAARRLSFEDNSFTRFTMDMVKQYMQEEEIRAQHKNMLLKIRERALKEKTKAEMDWLDQQKCQTRDKGADDSYPLIKKQQRALRIRLKQEQAEIKRLQEANQLASHERQMMLLQSQDIARLRQSTQQVLHQIDRRRIEKWLSAIDLSDYILSSESSLTSDQVREKLRNSGHIRAQTPEAATDDESMHIDDGSEDLRTPSPNKDYKSDSELYNDSVSGRPPSSDAKAIPVKMKSLDKKYLTEREKQLRTRRKYITQLMRRKKKLDEEEEQIAQLEKELERKKPKPGDTRKNGKGTSQSDSIRTETQATEDISHNESSRGASTTKDTSKTAPFSRSSSDNSNEDINTDSKYSTSISEDISGKPTHDSSDDTIVNNGNDSYSNETFDSGTEQATDTKKSAARTEPVGDEVVPSTAPASTSPSSPRRTAGISILPNNRIKPQSTHVPTRDRLANTSVSRKPSDSDSEESNMSTTWSETASDHSDAEGRIRALNEELKRRQLEAERLKKESKKKYKEQLKVQEETLRRQIEAYDTYICQIKTDLQNEQELSDPRKSVPPVIKHPGPWRQRGSSAKDLDCSIPVNTASPEDAGLSLVDTAVLPVASPIPTDPNDTIRQQMTPPPGAKNNLDTSSGIQPSSDISWKQTSTPESRPSLEKQVSESSSDDIEEVLPEQESGTTHTEDHELRLFLDEDEERVDGERSARREPEPSASARSMSEMSDEGADDQTHRSYTEDYDTSSENTLSQNSASITQTISSRSEDTASVTSEPKTHRSGERVDEDITIDESIHTEQDVDELSSEADESEHLMPNVSIPDTEPERMASQEEAVGASQPDELGGKDDASVSEESELDKVISISDAAVKEFYDEAELTPRPMQVDTGGKSPENLHGLVSNLTEVLTQKALQDTVDVVGAIADGRRSKATDSEERVVVPGADTIADKIASDQSNTTAGNLLKDAIENMIHVWKRKEITTAEEELPSEEVQIKKSKIDNTIIEQRDSPKQVDSFESKGGSSSILSALDLPPLDPKKSKTTLLSEEDLNTLYGDFDKMGEGDDVWWVDEDDVLGPGTKPPPAYPDKQQSTGTLTRKSLKADLEKWSEQLFYAVPHNKQEIVELVGDSVDVFWEMRRYGEPWENVTPPESFFSSEKDSSEDMSGRSRHAFKSLVFDVTAEVLREMYKDEQEEDEVERAPWTRSCPPRRKYHKDPAPPTTLDELRPIVENNVLFYLGMADKDTPLVNRPHPRKWGSRKKKDCVDEILVQELREEEPGWVNYDKDEVAVKMQLADSLMDSLLLESATVMANIYSQR